MYVVETVFLDSKFVGAKCLFDGIHTHKTAEDVTDGNETPSRCLEFLGGRVKVFHEWFDTAEHAEKYCNGEITCKVVLQTIPSPLNIGETTTQIISREYFNVDEEKGITPHKFIIEVIPIEHPEFLDYDGEGYDIITENSDLTQFIENNEIVLRTTITEREISLIRAYLDCRGYTMGTKNGKIYLGDLCAESDRIVWEETTIPKIIVRVSEISAELYWEAQEFSKNKDAPDYDFQQSRYNEIKKDNETIQSMVSYAK